MKALRYKVLLALFVMSSCQLPEPGPTPEADLSRLVQITSADPVLVELICERVLCGPGPVLNVDLTIQESSADFFRNNGLSLLTLTTGLFVSHSATVDYSITLDLKEHRPQKGSVTVRYGYWFILPFYAGLAGTNMGTLLNGYRDPVHLRRYCLDESPGEWRTFFDGSREEICNEYKRFLTVTLDSLWPRLEPVLAAVPPNANLKRVRIGVR